MKSKRNLFIIAGVVVVIILVVVFFVTRRSQNAQGQYQTVKADIGSLSATVGATGTVRANQDVQLAWQTAGTVDKVNVKVGDRVSAGDELANLAMTSLPQSIILAQADLVSAKRDLDQVLKSNTALAQAQQDLANARQAVEDAQDKVDSLTFPRASDNLVNQTQAEIDLAKKQVTRAEDAYKLVKNRPDGDSLKAQALYNLTNARQNLTNLIVKYNWYTGKATELDAEKYRAALALAQAQMEDAQREVDRLKDGPDADDIAVAKTRVAAAEATLNQAKITAPFSGMITLAEPLPGDQVAPGTVAFRLDDLSHLLVDVEISEIDINSIEVGQPVTMSFDAILGKSYNGMIAEVDQTGSIVQGAVNFTVTVELTDADEFVKPGMTAAVTILVKEVKDVLVVPNRAVRVVDGQRVVYVLKNGVPEAIKVRLGSSSDTDSEVVGGELKVGDLIVLNPPQTFGGPVGGPGGN
jgi:HlyD family secretion protein